MSEQLITFKTASTAKEKGFNLKVENYYIGTNNQLVKADSEEDFNNWFDTEQVKWTSAPSQSVLQKWLRDNHNIFLSVGPSFDDDSSRKPTGYHCDLFWIFEDNISRSKELPHNYSTEVKVEDIYKTYEEAYEAGLFEALKLIELPKEEKL